MLAAIRLRGSASTRRGIEDTLKILGMGKMNSTVVVEDTPTIRGMMLKAGDYLTWGEATEETKKIVDGLRRGLKPAKGGIKGIRGRYPKGEMGYRGEKINELIKRMV
ncbi:MAG: uL30 family ribosomal protein [Candidatus Aenigmarchaeota archaeon]|nr:uL30 family ribosomal protein [Candidatus Aenigmarchaeota archaeon]